MIDWWLVGIVIIVSFVCAIISDVLDKLADKLGGDDDD